MLARFGRQGEKSPFLRGAVGVMGYMGLTMGYIWGYIWVIYGLYGLYVLYRGYIGYMGLTMVVKCWKLLKPPHAFIGIQCL